MALMSIDLERAAWPSAARQSVSGYFGRRGDRGRRRADARAARLDHNTASLGALPDTVRQLPRARAYSLQRSWSRAARRRCTGPAFGYLIPPSLALGVGPRLLISIAVQIQIDRIQQSSRFYRLLTSCSDSLLLSCWSRLATPGGSRFLDDGRGALSETRPLAFMMFCPGVKPNRPSAADRAQSRSLR